MEFSIVITTKDRRQYLERALASLVLQAGAPPFEVIVVDNGSRDDTAAVVGSYADRAVPVRYVGEPQPNRAKARNRGVEGSHGDYVLFCDDDVLTPPGWIAAHAAAPAPVSLAHYILLLRHLGPLRQVPTQGADEADPVGGGARF